MRSYPPHPPARTASCLFLSAVALACFIGACTATRDPTQIFLPPPPLDHGVNLTIYRGGDATNMPVIHIWVDTAGDTVSVRTLMTSSLQGQYSCTGPDYCPCEGPVSAGGNGYWPLFCQTNGNVLPSMDAVGSASQSYPFDMPLYLSWDWTDHLHAVVPNGTYIIHAEVSGYHYGSPGEASITVTKNGAAGSATGAVDGSQWKAITADWKP